jgi:hypothetical protein
MPVNSLPTIHLTSEATAQPCNLPRGCLHTGQDRSGLGFVIFLVLVLVLVLGISVLRHEVLHNEQSGHVSALLEGDGRGNSGVLGWSKHCHVQVSNRGVYIFPSPKMAMNNEASIFYDEKMKFQGMKKIFYDEKMKK